MTDLYGVEASKPATDLEPRCSGCGRMLARLVTRPWRIDCPRCKVSNSAER